MKFYRFEDVLFAGMPYEDPGGGEHFGPSSLQIVCYVCDLIKETASGYWITQGYSGKCWVSKRGKKRYAYPTKEEAWRSFKLRKARQISIYAARLDRAQKSNSLSMP